jgi:hypothetical protein
MTSKQMSTNGMVRRAPALPAREAGKGRPRHGARHVSETQLSVAVIGIDIGKNLTNGARWVVQAERVGAVRHARKRLGLG